MKIFLKCAYVSLVIALLILNMNTVSAEVSDKFGICIHFMGHADKDLDMIKAAGFKYVRVDIEWKSIEKQKGVFDFEQYDILVKSLEKRKMKAVFILDYSNQLYEEYRSIRTEKGRMAFARFAAIAAKRYKDYDIIWEIWNEPNHPEFWQPELNVNDYMKLLNATVPAISKVDPEAYIIAPALTPGGNFCEYLEACMKNGLLDLVDAISIHPYWKRMPELQDQDLNRDVRELMEKYAPGKNLPIIFTEKGYPTSGWPDMPAMDDKLQAKFIVRYFLYSISIGTPLIFWYDWKDDGSEHINPEHNFGIVREDLKPKPAYYAMQKLVNTLKGYSFIRRLQTGESDFVLLFSNGEKTIAATWTINKPHRIKIQNRRSISLSDTVKYLDFTSLFSPVRKVEPVIKSNKVQVKQISAEMEVKQKKVRITDLIATYTNDLAPEVNKSTGKLITPSGETLDIELYFAKNLLMLNIAGKSYTTDSYSIIADKIKFSVLLNKTKNSRLIFKGTMNNNKIEGVVFDNAGKKGKWYITRQQ